MNSGNTEGHVCHGEKQSTSSPQSEDPMSLHLHNHEEPAQNSTKEEDKEEERSQKYMKGWRLYMLTLGYDIYPEVFQLD